MQPDEPVFAGVKVRFKEQSSASKKGHRGNVMENT